MQSKTALIITSISSPNRAMKEFATGALQHGVDFIVVGDVSSPPEFTLEGCRYFGVTEQRKTALTFAQKCPERHYSRKNIGYLLAIESGAEVILDTDDDNLPYPSFWENRERRQSARMVEQHGWVNVYRYFSQSQIWPRGFPLRHLKSSPPCLETEGERDVDCPIQQGLANENPDVDALYRLVFPLPESFASAPPVALGSKTWCPFNSQNTRWFRDAFPLLYLPSYCSFRMTDIWRSFVAQRIAWENDWAVLFYEPTVWQERNEHDLLKDFRDEIPGYLENERIAFILDAISLIRGVDAIPANMRTCYAALVEHGLIDREELELLELWLSDLDEMGT
jgi:hypothetical protein